MQLANPQLNVDQALLTQFADFVAKLLGLHFGRHRQNELLRKVCAITKECGYQDANDCMRDLMAGVADGQQIKVLAKHLTVGETYFFREPATFTILEQQILPQLIAARRQAGCHSLRFWCAGCCTGEEPYSLGMLLHRLLPDIEAWQVSILASDVNLQFLEHAATGSYKPWSFRGAQPTWITDYFDATGSEKLQIQARIRNMVSLFPLNLISNTYPSLDNGTSTVDLIFCRNVLMYFDEEQARRIVERLHQSLIGGGWLVVAATEVGRSYFDGFHCTDFEGTSLYHKQHGRPALAPTPRHTSSTLQVEPLPGNVISPARPRGPASEVTDSPVADSPYARAQAHYAQSDYAQVVAALSGYCEHAQAMLLVARAHANLGQLAEAAEWCRQAITLDRCDAASHYLLSTILDEQGHSEEALQTLRRVLYLQPDFVLAHLSLGALGRRLGHMDATRHFGNALQLLATHLPDAILPEAGGITVAQLTAIARMGHGGQHGGRQTN